ncbi:1673_t:CDS:1, partial [Funneliformis geosporum]
IKLIAQGNNTQLQNKVLNSIMPTFQVFESINDQIDKAITPLQIPLYQQLTP